MSSNKMNKLIKIHYSKFLLSDLHYASTSKCFLSASGAIHEVRMHGKGGGGISQGVYANVLVKGSRTEIGVQGGGGGGVKILTKFCTYLIDGPLLAFPLSWVIERE